jgi:hypothetical protein
LLASLQEGERQSLLAHIEVEAARINESPDEATKAKEPQALNRFRQKYPDVVLSPYTNSVLKNWKNGFKYFKFKPETK